MENIKIIAVTGNSGAGKSLFSKFLSNELQCEVFHLDEISHFSLENAEILAQIRQKFKNSVFDGDKLNRKKLSKIVFSDRNALVFLNSISLDFMQKYIDEKLKTYSRKFVIFDYALLPDMKYFAAASFKILLTCKKEVRHGRLASREGHSPDYFERRDGFCSKFETRKFDEIIDSSSLSEAQLQEAATKMAKKIQTLF